MSLIAKKKATENIPPLDGGTYIFVCVGVIDLGEQRNETYKNYSDKIMLIFEIPSETLEIDGEQKPRWLSKEYTCSLSAKSNLKKDVEAWIGKQLTDEDTENGFDVSQMLGKSGQISVIIEKSKEGKEYNKITSIMGLPKGMPSPDAVSAPLIYDIDNHNNEVFEKIPEWIRNKIMKSTQWQRNTEPKKIDFKENYDTDETVKESKPPF